MASCVNPWSKSPIYKVLTITITVEIVAAIRADEQMDKK